MGKDKKSKIVDVEIVSINPLQDDLDESIGSLGLGASVPVKLMQSIREGIGSGAKKLGRSFSKGSKKLGENLKMKRLEKWVDKNPKKTLAGVATPGILNVVRKHKQGDYDPDLSSTEGSFKHGGLVKLRSGKPKLAKKGWR
jgi:hypothetical protein